LIVAMMAMLRMASMPLASMQSMALRPRARRFQGLLRWAVPFLALAACAPASGNGGPQDRGASAAGAPRHDFQAGDSTLSLLEPGGGRCVWSKLDVVTRRRLALAGFDGDCRGGRIALAADGRRGAVWFDPGARSLPMWSGTTAFREAPAAAGARPRLFAVELGTGETAAVAVPAGLRDLGFDRAGRMIALTEQPLTAAEAERGTAIVDGRPIKLEPASDGVAVLVHALAFERGAWQRVETANSTDGWDLGLGVLALDLAQQLAFRSAEVLLPRVQGDDENDPAVLAKLARFAPQAHPVAGQLGWIRFGSGSTAFEVWEDGAELAWSTGLAAFVDAAGNPVQPPAWPFSENDRISYSWSGDYLLAAQDTIGAHPRVYRGGRLLWSSDAARATTFWPRRREQSHV
jgi:hypothetical protein